MVVPCCTGAWDVRGRARAHGALSSTLEHVAEAHRCARGKREVLKHLARYSSSLNREGPESAEMDS